MKVEYENKLRDIVYFLWYTCIRSPILIGIVFAIAGYFVWQSSGHLREEHSMVVVVITCILMTLMLAAAVLVITIPITFLMALSRKHRPFLTRHTLELHTHGFSASNEYMTSEIKWKIVQKLVRTRHYIFIYTGYGQAIIIPRRSFMQETDWNAFYWYLCDRAGKENIYRHTAADDSSEVIYDLTDDYIDYSDQ